MSLSKKKENLSIVESLDVESGSYLSWYFAEKTGDSEYSLKFLKEFKNLIGNNELIKKAFFSSLLYNDYALSLEFAKKILFFEPSNFFVNLILSTDAYVNGDYKKAENFLDNITSYEIDKNFIEVIYSWINISQGNIQKALEIYREKGDIACVPLNCLHEALILDMIDQNKLAEKNYEILAKSELKSYRILEILLDHYVRKKIKNQLKKYSIS